MRQQNRASGEAARDDAELRRRSTEVTPQLLVDAVDEMLVMQRGKELGYPRRRAVQEHPREHPQGEQARDRGAFQAALKQEGMTMADLRRSLERQMISRACSRWRSGQDRRHRDEAQAITTAQSRVHDAGRRDAAGDPRAGAEALATAGVNVGLDEEAREQGRRFRRARLAAKTSREMAAEDRSAVEGQRRPDRPYQRGGARAEAAPADRAHEGRARSPSRCARRAAIRFSSSNRRTGKG